MDKVLIANSAFIKSFTSTIIKTIALKKIKSIRREIFNSSLIPSVSEEIIQNNMAIRRISPDLSNIPRPLPDLSRIPLPPPMLMARMVFPAPKNYSIPMISGEYGKISPLLKDNSITAIECGGAGKELAIIRSGEKQQTKISLTEEEIKSLLEKISQKAKIPLIEGVFKAQADNFEINSVISEVIGARFIIRKQTPYNLIEKKEISHKLII
jgi:hypothetical protein